MLRTTGLISLVGINNQVDQNKLSPSVALNFDAGAVRSGFKIRGIRLVAGESGTGAVIKSAGDILLLNADPAIASNDAAITAAEWLTVVARITIAAANWGTGDANGADAQQSVDIPVVFPPDSSYRLWVAMFKTDAAALNDAAGDDEFLYVELLYEAA